MCSLQYCFSPASQYIQCCLQNMNTISFRLPPTLNTLVSSKQSKLRNPSQKRVSMCIHTYTEKVYIYIKGSWSKVPFVKHIRKFSFHRALTHPWPVSLVNLLPPLERRSTDRWVHRSPLSVRRRGLGTPGKLEPACDCRTSSSAARSQRQVCSSSMLHLWKVACLLLPTLSHLSATFSAVYYGLRLSVKAHAAVLSGKWGWWGGEYVCSSLLNITTGIWGGCVTGVQRERVFVWAWQQHP